MDVGNIMIGTAILVAVALLYPLVKTYIRHQANQQSMIYELQKHQLEIEKERREREQELHERELDAKRDAEDHDLGGYIIVDLPESDRSAFVDLLKGFEDYARLRGYTVLFSFDSSLPNKIAFKFTIADSGISVSREQVKRDLDQYLQKVRSGDPLDELPIVLSAQEHDLLLTTLKNRINFLTHSYNLAANTVAYYEALIYRSPWQRSFVERSPAVIVQTGGTIDGRSYRALGSSQVVQGDANRDLLLDYDSSLNIAGSFNQKVSQIDGLTNLIKLLRLCDSSDEGAKERCVRHLENVKDEMTQQEQPDKHRIRAWLTSAKDCFKTLSLTKDALDAVRQVYTSFNLHDLIANLPF